MQRQVMMSLALTLLVLTPAVVLLNPIMATDYNRFQLLNCLGWLALISTVVSLLPFFRSDRLRLLNGGQRKPDMTALHRSTDGLMEKISDFLGYFASGFAGSILMLLTGIALLCPPERLITVFTQYPQFPGFVATTFVNGSLCASLAAFAATLRDRRVLGEKAERLLMFLPVCMFIVILVLLPMADFMSWLLPANTQLILGGMNRVWPF
jgi:hypothetical protein